jgi:predicted metal-dependent enzyme (double-stranded beta helix superfamily)
MLITHAQHSLDTMLRHVAAAARRPPAERARAAAEALSLFAGSPDLPGRLSLPSSAERYVRHRLHSDPAGGFAVAALVWRPGQMSPVHAHRTWCALAVHKGILTEIQYGRATGQDDPVQRSTRQLQQGDISHGGADPGAIHRLANLGCGTAISIHVYGVPYEAFNEGVNLVYAS